MSRSHCDWPKLGAPLKPFLLTFFLYILPFLHIEVILYLKAAMPHSMPISVL